MSKNVTIVEMGLRDGLQNESVVVSAEARVQMVRHLVAAGMKRVEIGAFVSPKWVPQMANTKEVIAQVFELVNQKKISKKIGFSALVPNEKGMLDAIASGIKEVAFFTAASDSFAMKNINCTANESIIRLNQIVKLAKKHKIKVRGYISTAFYCPFEGKVKEAKVIELTKNLISAGCYEVSIGDTIGAATPGEIASLFKKLKKVVPIKKLAGHFHDTRGQALANVLAAYELGIRVFDTSVGGLGGCPYAPGATGNVSTEDVVYMFDGMKIKTGINNEQLISLNPEISNMVNHPTRSSVGNVGKLKKGV